MKAPAYDLRPADPDDVRRLCARYHAYQGAGDTATYAYGVYEDGQCVAGWLWQPPPPGAAKAVCPAAPHAVLALSRMVAVPREMRRLRHISRPLRRMMRVAGYLDRGRWPVLVTWSDEGLGHTGHVYRCSGWTRTVRSRQPIFEDAQGRRVSRYRNGVTGTDRLVRAGHTWIQRWEHWACAAEGAVEHVRRAGWVRVPVAGRRWRSGRQAHTWVRVTPSNGVPLTLPGIS